jgi:hypothetical protein
MCLLFKISNEDVQYVRKKISNEDVQYVRKKISNEDVQYVRKKISNEDVQYVRKKISNEDDVSSIWCTFLLFLTFNFLHLQAKWFFIPQFEQVLPYAGHSSCM